MDMTLPEQLVWAAAYAREHAKGKGDDQEEVFWARCCVVATAAVVDMRYTFKMAVGTPGMKVLLNKLAYDHLRQMTFKVED